VEGGRLAVRWLRRAYEVKGESEDGHAESVLISFPSPNWWRLVATLAAVDLLGATGRESVDLGNGWNMRRLPDGQVEFRGPADDS
jgi:hypothetical protein